MDFLEGVDQKLATITFLGAFFGAGLTALVAVLIHKLELNAKKDEKERNMVNDVDSKIDLSIYKAKKITKIELFSGMVYGNPEETVENCNIILEGVEELEEGILKIINPLKNISSNPEEISKEILELTTLFENSKRSFKNVFRMYVNRRFKNMDIYTDKNFSVGSQVSTVSKSLLNKKKDLDNALENYISNLEELRKIKINR